MMVPGYDADDASENLTEIKNREAEHTHTDTDDDSTITFNKLNGHWDTGSASDFMTEYSV